ncbi:MAG: TonB-dependent receptor, partial [Alphaproteobacteria bacterium]
MKSGVYPNARSILRVALMASAAFAQPVLAQESQGVEEIIVTAQKREQNLQTVPISITALSQDAIKANRIQDVRDLNAIAPNLTVRLSGGGSQIPNFTLRGILTSGTAAGTDKGVALYLDGVYMQAVQGSVFDFADIERIEVLKGPQGTLFGRNATGGAISITTRTPTGRFSARQELSYGNLDQLRSKTRVDLPQIGPFSATITYLHSEKRGDIRNSGAGTVWNYGPATNGK